MIGRISATAAAITPVAAAALAKSGSAAVQQPTVWHFFGYPFEAAGMVAAIFGVVAARFWVGAAQSLKREHRWSLDVPVSGMALAASAGVVIARNMAPITALMVGAGIGIIGEGLFKIAEARGRGVLGLNDKSPD